MEFIKDSIAVCMGMILYRYFPALVIYIHKRTDFYFVKKWTVDGMYYHCICLLQIKNTERTLFAKSLWVTKKRPITASQSKQQ